MFHYPESSGAVAEATWTTGCVAPRFSGRVCGFLNNSGITGVWKAQRSFHGWLDHLHFRFGNAVNTEIVVLFFHVFMDPFTPPWGVQPSSPLLLSPSHTLLQSLLITAVTLWWEVNTPTPSISLAPVPLWLLGAGGYTYIYLCTVVQPDHLLLSVDTINVINNWEKTDFYHLQASKNSTGAMCCF